MTYIRLTDGQKKTCRNQYRSDAMFRAWAWTLSRIEHQYGELSAVEVWHEVQMLCAQLASVTSYRDTEAELLFSELCERHSAWQDAQENFVTKKRTSREAEQTATIILTVLFTLMSDAAPDEQDDATERNPNKTICRVLAREIMCPERRTIAEQLIAAFASRRYDNDGNKIVLPVTDYLETSDNSALLLNDDPSKECLNNPCHIMPGSPQYLRLVETISSCADPQNRDAQMSLAKSMIPVEYQGQLMADLKNGIKPTVQFLQTNNFNAPIQSVIGHSENTNLNN